MSVFAGPKSSTSNLLLCYDGFNYKNFEVFSSNFYVNSNFSGGGGMPQESDSNPTNTIVRLDNPGSTPFVLEQTAGVAYTEYQINLTTQLVSSKTYVMSGWYAESSDYSCADGSRMFHARAFSSSGNHIATGIGIGTVLRTVVINGITWKYCYELISTPSDYSNVFNWYVGYGGSNYTGKRYYTNLKMELGTYPSLRNLVQDNFHGSALGGISLEGNNNLTFNGTSGSISIGTIGGYSNSITCEAVFKTTSSATWKNILCGPTNDIIFTVNGDKLNFGCQGNSPIAHANYSTTVVNTGAWFHGAATYDGSNVRIYINGVLESTTARTGNITPGSLNMGSNSGGSSEFFNGTLGLVKFYNRALTGNEIAQNFNALRGRFGI